MDIRLAHSGDEAAIRACAQAAYVRYVPLIGREPAPMLADYGAQIAGGLVHVAVDGQGALAGFIVYYPEGRHMLLENVAVAPNAAGRGVGKALIAHCERAARQAGLGGVMLYTNAKMVENLSIYPRLGYQEVDRRTEDGFDRVYFLKPF
ncbi:GNAT family N-acetyltransferase [Donghicola mangrovi]